MAAGVGCALASPAIARAQAGALRVVIVDSAAKPVRDADVELRGGTGTMTTALRTDSLGSARFSSTARAAAQEIVVQRIGYFATRRRVPPAAVGEIEIGLARIAITLDTVRSAGRSVQRGAQPAITAAEIDSTRKGVFDVLDVLRKLRPELMDAIATDLRARCFPDRIHGALRFYVNEQYVPRDALLVLHDVKSEAIAEVRYVRCFDRSIAKDDYPGAGHLYITLRGGYAFNLKRGAFKRDSLVPAAAVTDTTLLVATSPRIVGVYDERTGIPIEGARITDLVGGASALTTRTGTVALAFVDTNGTMLKIDRIGYVPLVLAVTNRPADPPLTLTLTPRGAASPRLTHARGAADTVRKLELAGFYDRRDTIAVTGAAFLDARRQPLHQMSEIASSMHRDVCAANLWIDGVRAAGIIEELLDPAMVLAVESYEGAEVPDEFAARRAQLIRCATLVWTN